jgi:hypothetical protein
VRDMSRSARTDTLMNSSRRPITLLAWLVGLTLTVAAGVGTSAAQGTGPSVEKVAQPGQDESLILRQRAAEYWAARVARDYRKQWELSEPRLKGRTTPEEYGAGKGAIQYLGYEVGDASINGSFASVQVKVIGRITLPNSRAQPVTRTSSVPDAWIKVEGIWYRRADQPESPGGPPGAPSGALQPSGTLQ